MNKKFLQTLIFSTALLVTTSLLSGYACCLQIGEVGTAYCHLNDANGTWLGPITIPMVHDWNGILVPQQSNSDLITQCYQTYQACYQNARGCYADPSG